MERHVLVLVASNVSTDELAAAVGERFDDNTKVHVVAPASGLSRLDWLTNAEDDARADAAERAAGAADVISGDTVEARAGDTDPVLALEDAVRRVDARVDEVVVVAKPDTEASWLEAGAVASARERLQIPITHIVVG